MRLNDGKEVWRVETEKAGYAGGMLATAGNLAIWATQGGEITVANSNNGQILWQLDTNTASKSGPMTYMVDGKQLITWALGGSPGFGSAPDDWNVNHASFVITIGQ